MKILNLIIATLLTSTMLISCSSEVTTTSNTPDSAPATAQGGTVEVSTPVVDAVIPVEETGPSEAEIGALNTDGWAVRAVSSLAQSNYLLSGFTGDVEYFIRTTADEFGSVNFEVCPADATEESFGQAPWTTHEWDMQSQLVKDAVASGEFSLIISDGGIISENLSDRISDAIPPQPGVDVVNTGDLITDDMTGEEIDAITIRLACSLAQANYLLSGYSGDVAYFIKTTATETGTVDIEVCPADASLESFGKTPWTSHEWDIKSEMAQTAVDSGEFVLSILDGGEVSENLSVVLFESVA